MQAYRHCDVADMAGEFLSGNSAETVGKAPRDPGIVGLRGREIKRFSKSLRTVPTDGLRQIKPRSLSDHRRREFLLVPMPGCGRSPDRATRARSEASRHIPMVSFLAWEPRHMQNQRVWLASGAFVPTPERGNERLRSRKPVKLSRPTRLQRRRTENRTITTNHSFCIL